MNVSLEVFNCLEKKSESCFTEANVNANIYLPSVLGI